MDGRNGSTIPVNNINFICSIIFTITFFKAIKYNMPQMLWLFILNNKKRFKGCDFLTTFIPFIFYIYIYLFIYLLILFIYNITIILFILFVYNFNYTQIKL